MKQSLVCIILFWLLAYCNNDKPSEKQRQEIPTTKTLRDSFEQHFRILDSVVKHQPSVTLYRCCTTSIDFMEEKTEIEPSSPGDFSGRRYFTKKDWEKWH